MLSFRTDIAATTARLDSLVSGLKRTAPLFKTWGLRSRDLARKHAAAHSKGGKFWKSIARATVLSRVDASGATVECQHFAGWHKEHGGTISAVKAKALTIPIAPQAEGKTAAEFSLGGKRLFVPKGSSLLGYSDGTRFVPLFLLRRRVSQKAEPWWPSASEITAIGEQEALWWLERQVKA